MDHTTVNCEEIERKKILRKALDAIDGLQAELNTVRRERCEPIAIVGLSCRLPGAPSPEAFWRLLRDGVNAVKQAPPGRWDKDGAAGVPCGGFLDRVDLFDAGFFGISGREAESMDPQQRLLLEVAWEALENAGIAAHTLRGTSSGVFVGITTADYGRLAISRPPANLDVYTATGGALNVAAGRLAYVLGLNGPAMAVDTACSSSLVAIHLACQSLRGRESDLALAAGVNLLLTPEPFICFEKWGMMAPDGRCKTFDEAADGFVRGEGCGVTVLKRLSDALAAGDRVLAVIRGTAVNQDGATSGLTVPNGLSQQAVVRAALSASGLQPEEVDYVEAHGTGTTLGDPIELEALGAVLGKNRPAEKPLLVGSVKTNLGHLESASGITGLIKIVLALQHEEIPPHLHFKKLSPRISLRNAAIKIPVCKTSWKKSAHPRIAGVSSFGFSGTNAHAILEEAPSEPTPCETGEDRPAHLLVLSAESESALKELSKSCAEHFDKTPGLRWPDVCHTAAIGRSPLSCRLALPASDMASAREALRAFAQGGVAPGVLSGRKRAGVKLAFLFTGEGSHYPAMGAALYRSEPVFRLAIERCAGILREYLDQPLQSVMGYDEAKPGSCEELLEQTSYAQPALFALEYALTALWRSWGIEPAAVVGHGLGEYVAACVAGVLSLEDALRLVALRARLMQALSPGASKELMLDEFERLAGEVRCAPASIDLASNVTGALLTPETKMDAAYWRRHARETVRFTEDIRALHTRGIRVFLEVGPGPALMDMVRQSVDDPGAVWLSSLCPKQDAQMLATLGALFVLGINPDWKAFDKPHPRHRVALPTYPFQRTRFWLPETSPRAEAHSAVAPAGAHPLLGWHVSLAKQPGTHIWQSELSLERCPWLKDHQVQGVAVVPATAFIELALSAAVQTLASPPVVVSKIKIEKVLSLHPGFVFTLQTRLEPSSDGATQFEVWSQKKGNGDNWIRHARGCLRAGGVETPPATLDASGIDAIRRRCAQSLESSEFYKLHRERGNQWGPCFQGVRRLWRGAGEALSEVEAPTVIQDELSAYQFHPALADAAGHVLTAAVPLEGGDEKQGGAFVGAGIETIRFYRRPEGARLWAHARIRKKQQVPKNVLLGDVHVYDSSGNLISETLGARLWYLDAAAKRNLLQDAESCYYEARWVKKNRDTGIVNSSFQLEQQCKTIEPSEPSSSPSPSQGEGWGEDSVSSIPRSEKTPVSQSSSAREPLSGTWIVFSDKQGVSEALCSELRGRGATCISIFPSEQGFKADGTSMTVRPENLEDYTLALAAASRSGSPLRGVVHLWSLDAADPEAADLEAVRRAQIYGPTSVLRLVQAFAQAGAKLWLVTRGAQPAGDRPEPLSLLQSPLWGLGRTIAVEHSDCWGGQVDLDPSDDPATSASLLSQQITDSQGEDQVAFRNGVRRVLRLARWESSSREHNKVSIRPDASYLITGGLGGIGLAIARWLADQGARHVILAGRTPLPARAEWERAQSDTPEARRIEAICALERMGVKVRTVSVDMGDTASVSLLLREILANKDHPLRGVLHAAGVMQYQPLTCQSPDQMREVLAAKMVGGWLLHQGLANTDLDFFVLFSSASSLLSSPLMGSYSAANAFLDALAHHRRALGQTALSINWGTWGETGMATRFLTDEAFKRQGRSGATKGIGSLSTQKALEAFSYLLESGAAQAGVIPVNWHEWRQAYATLTNAPYLSMLLPETQPPPQKEPPGDRDRERLLSLPPDSRAQALETYLARKVAAILKVPMESIDAEKPISSLGFDSLMSLELKAQLEKDLGEGVAMARLLEGPTLAELRQLLMDLLVKSTSADRPATSSARATEWEEGQL